MSLMTRLKEETADQHAHAESRPIEQAMIQGRLDRAGYAELLAQRYLIHKSLEERVRGLRAAHPFIAEIVEDQLFQEANLAADLAFFGRDPQHSRPLPATRQFIDNIRAAAEANPMSLLGVYYVFEGSKNGARFVARRMAPALGIGEAGGMRYLDPHGEAQRGLWQEFKTRMDAAGFSPADQDAMVSAAKMTFDAVSAIDDELHERISAVA